MNLNQVLLFNIQIEIWDQDNIELLSFSIKTLQISIKNIQIGKTPFRSGVFPKVTEIIVLKFHYDHLKHRINSD
jgi:hypothetical protein